MSLRIVGGRIIDPANHIDRIADLFIDEGRIAAIGEAPAGFVADRVLDAGGCIVMPGLVDLAARLREPGQEYKATIASETRAAAAAGITTLCMPPDTEPIADSPAELKLIQQRAEQAGFCRVNPLGALTSGLKGETLSELAGLKGAGCTGVTNVLAPVTSTLVLRRAMEYVASQDLILFLHPLDHALSQRGCAHEGAVASRLGLPAIPTAAETAALGQQLALIEETGVRAHFCRLSTARAAAMIARARHEGLPVSADVCAHQLFLTDQAIGDFNSLCHVIPPFRTQADRDALRMAVASGAVAAVCSDHQPHETDAKQTPFPASEPGISALETLLALMLRLVDDGLLTLTDAIARVTSGPAEVLRAPAGSLATGKPADICIYDRESSWKLETDKMLSDGRNTPFAGWEFSGRVQCTLLDGRSVYQMPEDYL